MGLPDMPWSDWEIKADDIHITKDETGAPIKLGSGAYGTVSFICFALKIPETVAHRRLRQTQWLTMAP